MLRTESVQTSAKRVLVKNKADKSKKKKAKLITFCQYIDSVYTKYKISNTDLKFAVYREVFYFIIDNYNDELSYDEINQVATLDESFIFDELEGIVNKEIEKNHTKKSNL